MCSTIIAQVLANSQKDKLEGYNGNIDIYNRPQVDNGDGTISTVRSIGFNDGESEVVIPTVSDDANPRVMEDYEAIEYYYDGPRRRGEEPRYLGKFKTVKEANEFAERLHQQQERYYSKKRGKK